MLTRLLVWRLTADLDRWTEVVLEPSLALARRTIGDGRG